MKYMKKIKEIYYSFTTFFRNLKLFWKVLRNYHWWDYQHVIDANIVMFKDMAEHFENEGSHISNKKVAANIRELVKLLEKDIETEAYEKCKSIEDINKRSFKEGAMIDKHKKSIARLLFGPTYKQQCIQQDKMIQAIEQGMSQEEAILKHIDYTGIENWWD